MTLVQFVSPSPSELFLVLLRSVEAVLIVEVFADSLVVFLVIKLLLPHLLALLPFSPELVVQFLLSFEVELVLFLPLALTLFPLVITSLLSVLLTLIILQRSVVMDLVVVTVVKILLLAVEFVLISVEVEAGTFEELWSLVARLLPQKPDLCSFVGRFALSDAWRRVSSLKVSNLLSTQSFEGQVVLSQVLLVLLVLAPLLFTMGVASLRKIHRHKGNPGLFLLLSQSLISSLLEVNGVL